MTTHTGKRCARFGSIGVPRGRVLVAALLLASASVVAQSPHPFGRPSADVPNPGADNTAVRATRPAGYRDQGRSEVLARHGMAATSQPLATTAALRILLAGGNAIDAAVAASATLGLVEPMSTGMGGDLFALVWSARDKKLYGLASSGWAPKGWTVGHFKSTLGVDKRPIERHQLGGRSGDRLRAGTRS